jgi:hypothetical protein
MDRKTALKIIDDLITRLRSDMEQEVGDMSVHWEREEIEWLLVRMAENMTCARWNLGLRRRSFKLWLLSKHL